VRTGRPRQFDEREVLERAMQLFWEKGYQAVGLSELLARMGISRQSLYATFGNKRELFVRAIHHYRETQLAQALALLGREGSRVANVKDVVRFFEGLATDGSCRGCLVANTLVELGPHDEEVSHLLRETLGLLQGAIEAALREAQAQGELAPSKSPLELSRALTNAIIGLAVTGRLRLEPRAIRDAYAGTLSMLD
jgi:TetR/AcrR family transcriptional repressor of nem operon